MSFWKLSGRLAKSLRFRTATKVATLWRMVHYGSRKGEGAADGMIRAWFRRGLAALVGAAALSSGPLLALAPEPAQVVAPSIAEPRPALWRLSDEDTTIYLFGTVHALPDGLDWNRGAVADAFEAADELVLETDVTGASFGDMMTAMMGAMAVDQPPILDRVPPERRERLRQIIEQSPFPLSLYDRMKTWSAAMLLSMQVLERLGMESGNGVDGTLGERWQRRGRTVIGLESAADQNAFLDGLSQETQRRWLASIAEDEEDDVDELNRDLDAWARGDVETLARIDAEDDEDLPELRDVLLRQRNLRWVQWLRARMERPGTVFLAVGAAHLAGEDSLQRLLAEQSLTTERLQ